MSWRDRLQGKIVLTSPRGDVFSASWISNERSFQRKVGIFDFPGVDGAEVQDLGAAASIHPIAFSFEGPDNDLEGSRFFRAGSSQKGVWQVQHPVKGRLSLQLLSVAEKISPVENGNITYFQTEWIQPINKADTIPLVQQSFNTLSRVTTTNAASMGQFSKAKQITAGQKWAVVSKIQKTVQFVQDRVELLYKPLASLNRQITSVRTGILDELTETVIDFAGLAGQVHTLLQLPAMAIEDVSTRISAYSKLLEDLYTLSPDETDATLRIKDPQELRNAALAQELSVVGCFGALAMVAVTGTMTNRIEAVAAVNDISRCFSEGTAELDKSQSLLEIRNIDQQYFSQGESYADCLALISGALAYLLDASYSLAIEKRFVLERPRAPIEIVVSEYGKIEGAFDEFIKINKLSGKEILLLPAGREVAVYV